MGANLIERVQRLFLCSRGFHHWEEWEYVDGTSCRQQRGCSRCEAVETREGHPWGVWEYTGRAACLQKRVCERCGIVAEQINHAWVSDDGYDEEVYCRAPRRCEHCGETDEQRHDFKYIGSTYQGYDLIVNKIYQCDCGKSYSVEDYC